MPLEAKAESLLQWKVAGLTHLTYVTVDGWKLEPRSALRQTGWLRSGPQHHGCGVRFLLSAGRSSIWPQRRLANVLRRVWQLHLKASVAWTSLDLRKSMASHAGSNGSSNSSDCKFWRLESGWREGVGCPWRFFFGLHSDLQSYKKSRLQVEYVAGWDFARPWACNPGRCELKVNFSFSGRFFFDIPLWRLDQRQHIEQSL